MAILAPRLSSTLLGWSRGGVGPDDLQELEADLVAGCWTLVRAAMADGDPPQRPGLALVDQAASVVRDRRDTTRRRASRHHSPELCSRPNSDRPNSDRPNRNGPDGWDLADPGGGDPRPRIELLAIALAEGHGSGELASTPARALYLTRVVGLSTAEAADQLCIGRPSLRALRSRAARHLGAALDDRQAA